MANGCDVTEKIKLKVNVRGGRTRHWLLKRCMGTEIK